MPGASRVKCGEGGQNGRLNNVILICLQITSDFGWFKTRPRSVYNLAFNESQVQLLRRSQCLANHPESHASSS